jgi:hypothetical protein
MIFWPEMDFWLEMAFCFFQMNLPLMAESLQACFGDFFLILK